MLQTVPYCDELSDEWDDLVIHSPDGWTWALTSWRRTILAVERWGLQDHSFAVSDGHRLVAVMPLQYFPAGNRMESSGWGLCGPVVANGIEGKYRKKILKTTFQHAEETSCTYGATELRFGAPPVVQRSLDAPWGVNPYAEYGFEDVSTLSRVIDLTSSEEQLWHDCSETARQTVTKARAKGFHVNIVDWRDYLDIYYDVHVETYTRTGVPPHPKKYFQGIAENMQLIGNTILWCCFTDDGKPVAFHNSCVFANKGMYHTACSLSAYLNDGVNYLLFYEAMIGLKHKGIHWYECGNIFPECEDAQDKRKGLTEFKTKFGGETHHSFISKKEFTYFIPDISCKPGCKILFSDFVRSGWKLGNEIAKYLKNQSRWI